MPLTITLNDYTMSTAVTTEKPVTKNENGPVEPQISVTKPSGSTSGAGGGGGRMPPSLDQLAARLNTQSQSTTPASQSSQSSGVGIGIGPRSRLPAALLRTASQQSERSSATNDSLAVQPPTTRTGSPDASTPGVSAASTPSVPIEPTDTELTTENLEKLNISEEAKDEVGDTVGTVKKENKIPRGYKNIPSLETITRRMQKTRTLSVDGSAMPSPGGSGLPGIGADESHLDKIEEFMKQRDLEEQEARSKEHPLQYSWTIYHDSKPKIPAPSSAEQPWTPPPTAETNAYEAQLTVVGDFKTVESYCRYMNWLKPPSTLERNSNYHLFKDKIKPMWEDEANANGGKWVLTMRNNPQLLDRCWSYLSMAMVGEELEDAVEN